MEILEYIERNGFPKTWEKTFQNDISGIKEACNKLIDDNIKYTPNADCVFRAFELTQFDQVKVVIVGQDPYYQPNVANGLSFSSNRECLVQASLANIFKELKNSIPEFNVPKHGDLTKWAEQGVLMLNKSLTAKEGVPNDHPSLWMSLIDSVIMTLTNSNKKIIWVLWGKEAQKLGRIIGEKGIKLTSPHPSPQSAHTGFLGNGHFSKINEILISQGKTPINWNLD